MPILPIIILGLIQGITEFLPISSSAHLIIAPYLFDFEIAKKERKNLIEKASICINGISLTISKKTLKGFQIWVIPHTFKLTNLSSLKKISTSVLTLYKLLSV